MTSGDGNTITAHLRGILGAGSCCGLSDVELLENFVARQDESSFAVLVRRHGGMVWGVCRRLLTHHQDAEDAFQATFLVLACKAAAIGRRNQLPNWLFGVARRAALNLRTRRARRAQREHLCADPPEIPLHFEPSWNSSRGVLDEEIARLPAKYRLPLLLCGLEGLTHAQAAKCLGWPTGTVAGRLSRGRVLLRTRLLRRGITAPVAAALTTMLAAEPAVAAVSPQLIAASVRGAIALVVAGKSAALNSPVISTLLHRVLLRMFLSRLLKTTVLIAALAMTVVGAGVIWYRTPSTETVASEDVGKYRPQAQTPAASSPGRDAPSKPSLRLPNDPNAAVFRMDRSVDGVMGPGMVLTIFADGRVVAKVPEGLFSVAATDLTSYENERIIADALKENPKPRKIKVLKGKISVGELEALLRFALHDQEFFDFDESSVKTTIRDRYQSDGKVTDSNDATTTGFNIQTAVRNHEVRWYRLAKSAWDFPDVERLSQLQAVEARLSHVFYVVLAGGQERVEAVAAEMDKLAQPYYLLYPNAPRLTTCSR